MSATARIVKGEYRGFSLEKKFFTLLNHLKKRDCDSLHGFDPERKGTLKTR